jgi:uracil-DNA glycosylase
MSTSSPRLQSDVLTTLLRDITACRICVERPSGQPLPHEPRPVLRPSTTARLCIASQAPGTRAHRSGIPFTDASGVRLRTWMGLDEATFYDQSRIAIVPMGFCFPGLDAKGGDRPPRRECAPAWRRRVFAAMPRLELILTIGRYAQEWHLDGAARDGMTAAVRRYRDLLASPDQPKFFALPHPSWRNTGWLKKNPWFEAEVLPILRREVQRLL